MPCLGAKQGRIDVERAACHDEPVEQIEIAPDLIHLMRQGQRQPAGPHHGGAVILPDRVPGKFGVSARLLGIEGQADEGLFHACIQGVILGRRVGAKPGTGNGRA